MAQNIKLAENEVKEQVKADEQSVQEPAKKDVVVQRKM